MSIVWTLTALFLAQAPPTPTPPPPQGYVISDGMIRALAKRMAFELGGQIDLDETQERAVAEALRNEWTPFIHEHHDELAPLFDGWIQAFMNPDAPSDAEVKQWAEAALDLQSKFIAQMDHSDQAVARLLRPDQKARFMAEVAKARAGVSAFAIELHKWRNGHVDRRYWEGEQARRERRRQRKFGEDAAQDAPQRSRSQQMLSDWDAYVLDITMRFDFDASQKSTAYGILADIKDRAKAYIATRRQVIEVALSGSPAPENDNAATDDVLAPIDALFDELVSRLDALPTEKQRAAVTPAP